MRTIRLLGDRVLVRVQQNLPTQGGLFLPEHRHPSGSGWIVAVGPDAAKLGLAVGQRIAFKPLHGTDFPWNGETLKLLQIGLGKIYVGDDVLGILWDDSKVDVSA
jgi:co-chaperonin GroES (HSP10)